MPSSRRALRFGLFLAAAIASVPLRAFGADTPQDRAEAQRLYAEGRKLRADGDPAGALDRFRRAHDLMPTPVTRLDLARALESQKRLVEAHDLLASIAAMPVSRTETQKSKIAREEAASLAAAVAPRIPKVTIVVPGAAEPEVAIDGQPVSKVLLGGELPIDPGEHTVSARQGERVVEQALVLAEGERRTVELKLPAPPEPAAEPAPAPPASSAPPRAAPLPPPAAPAPRPATLASTRRVTPVVPIAFAVGGLGIATGVVTGLVALSQTGALQEGCPERQCPPEQHGLLSTHQALTTTSTIAFSVGGAAAAAGAAAWILDARTAAPAAAPAGTIRIRWVGTGVAVEGAW